MFSKPDEIQRKHEANLLRSYANKLILPEGVSFPPDKLIEHQPRELYRAPEYLAKTATPEEVADLNDILHELWGINEQHVGENTREIEVYYSVSGESCALAERLRCWYHSYFEKRADPQHLSPQCHNDPFQLFLKLMKEYRLLVDKLVDIQPSLNFIFFAPTRDYVPWLLYQRLWKDRIQILGELLLVKYDPADPYTAEIMAWYIQRGRWATDYVAKFLSKLSGAADPVRLQAIGRESDLVLRDRLAALTADIQEMRRFLIRGFHASKTMVSFGPDLTAAWVWSINAGIASLIGGASEVEVEKSVETHQGTLAVRINHDGLLADTRKPWLTVDNACAVDGVRPLVLNYYVLERFHEKLFSFYDRIDFKRIRAKARSSILETDLEEEVIALSCQDLAARDAEAEPEEVLPAQVGKRRIGTLRCQRLLNLLANHFDCEVLPGKGSEVTVYREGGKKFVLGHHTHNPEISSVVVGRLLKRLGVRLSDWLTVVYG